MRTVCSSSSQGDDAKEVVTVCALYGDLGLSGPALVAAGTAWPRIEYEAAWATVAQLAGQDLPWWPSLLRLPQLISQWRPGASIVTAEVPANDRETTLRRAARNSAFDPQAKAALTDMANDIRNQRVDDVSEIRIYGKGHAGRGRSPIIVAAQHDASAHPIPCEKDRESLAAGWKALTTSTQPDAVAAVGVALTRDPRLLPYGALTKAPAKRDTVVDRWARWLVPCDPTAGHAALAEDRPIDAFFTDPLTDMPVVRTQGEQPRWLFYAPLALPADHGELASVVLYYGVWITTTDGQVHPASCDPREHLWFGDGGGDRATEAAAGHQPAPGRLAADIDLSEHWKAPEGLTALLNEKHRQGAQLSRAALLHARMSPPKSEY